MSMEHCMVGSVCHLFKVGGGPDCGTCVHNKHLFNSMAKKEKPMVPSAPAESMEKNVNHPTRYTKGKVECIDALEAAVVGKLPDEAICVANVIKYLWRYEEKEPLRSLKSAEWYLKRLIAKVEARTQQANNG